MYFIILGGKGRFLNRLAEDNEQCSDNASVLSGLTEVEILSLIPERRLCLLS